MKYPLRLTKRKSKANVNNMPVTNGILQLINFCIFLDSSSILGI